MDVPITDVEALPLAGKSEVKRGTVCLVPIRSINRSSAHGNLRKHGRSFGSAPRHTARRPALAWRSCWRRTRSFQIPRLVASSGSTKTLSGTGVSAGSKKDSLSGTSLTQAVRGFSPPRLITTIKSIACEVPATRDEPLSRLFVPDIQRILIAEKHVRSISRSTIWRVLDADALKPWRHRSWIWSRDPQFYERGAPILDLYQGKWKGRGLRKDEFVISADEKTSIQARIRLHETEIVADGRGQRVEHEYERGGAWAYMAALDVHRARVFGRVEKSNGIEPFQRLVRQVMTREPYASARRVFWIVDQGSSHHPNTFPGRLREEFPNAVGLSLPVHASWLNQIEIYFSILQRKALTPNDFPDLNAVRQRLYGFAKLFNRRAIPFNWNFTRHKLRKFLKRLDATSYRDAA